MPGVEGKLVRSREGRFVFFVLPTHLDLIGKKIERRFVNKSLDEDIIFDELNIQIPFINTLKEDVHSIIRYAFTEMVNNAIEHSQSFGIEITLEEIDSKIIFEVRDSGIGAFKNIMQKKHLASELEAIQELLKGKTTTLPHSHSGEGIFFTSKIADIFILDSFEYRLRVDNTINDVFVEKIGAFTGTRVRFELNKDSKKHLNDIFFEYQAEPDSYSFDKTKVHVKLFKAGTVYISRSQARRLMANLEKFKLIILDFEGIDTIGQAFADEVFRVFLSKNPKIKIEAINTSETVTFMIGRVQKAQLTIPSLEEKK
jgi:anti-sigma regulatory factor (Ser/Thr protein kinase)/uncharacterized protein (DUF1330 family)